jgi:hypothetical protein
LRDLSIGGNAGRLWTRHELRSAQARAFSESREYLLPVRFDDTALPSINPPVGYIDLRFKTPEALAELIVQKVQTTGREDAPTASPVGASPVPRTLERARTNQGLGAFKSSRFLMARLPIPVAGALLWVLAVTFLYTISTYLSLWAVAAPIGVVSLAYGVVAYVTRDRSVAPLVAALACGFICGGSTYLLVHDDSGRYGFVFGLAFGWLATRHLVARDERMRILAIVVVGIWLLAGFGVLQDSEFYRHGLPGGAILAGAVATLVSLAVAAIMRDVGKVKA